jgi:hypothetical protein
MPMMLNKFPDEARIIGRILTGYSELEYQLSMCAGLAIDNRVVAFRCLFQLRGENVRLVAADALMRSAYETIGLKDEYEACLSALRVSKSIRNQYAHAHWIGFDPEGLFFTDMEKTAKSAAVKNYAQSAAHRCSASKSSRDIPGLRPRLALVSSSRVRTSGGQIVQPRPESSENNRTAASA